MALPPEATRAKIARRKPPKRANVYIPPGGTAGYAPTKPKPQFKQLAKALPKVTAPPAPQPRVLRSPAATEARSVRKRAKRVEISALRKRTGGPAPIVVRRRQKVRQQERGLQQLTQVLADLSAPKPGGPQPKAKGISPPGPREITSKPTKLEREIQNLGERKPDKKRPGGVIGTGLAAVSLADKLLSGKATAGLVSGASKASSEVLASGFGGKPIGDFLAGQILGHPVKKTDIKVGPAPYAQRALKGVGRDIVDLPAGFIPSLYVPAKASVKAQTQLIKGEPGKAAKTLYKEGIKPVYEGGKQTVSHPLEHPIGAALTVSGVESVVGRGAGFAARAGAAGKIGKRAGRTARPAKVIPGTEAGTARPYSPDIIRKGAQVAGEKLSERRAVRKGEPSPKTRMSKGDIRRETDDFLRTSRNVAGMAEGQAVHDVARATTHTGRAKRIVSRKARKAEKVTAAHTIAVQGLANATKADLQRLLAETKAAGEKLGGDAKRENAKRQQELQDAIDKHRGAATETHIRQTQQEYRQNVDQPQEQQMVDLGILEQRHADVARYTPAAVRHGLHDPETAGKHIAVARDARQAAEKERAQAHKAKGKANNFLRTMVQRTRASELGPRGKRSRGLDVAEAQHRAATKALADTHTQLDRAVRDTEAEHVAAHHDAAMATTKVSKTPAVQAAERELADAAKHLAALERRAAGRERGSGRLEGRAQEKVRAADVAARRRGEPAAGTKPVGTLARLERRGGEDLQLQNDIARARERVTAARTKLGKERSRFAGVPPAKADRLRNAIINLAKARLAKRQGHGIEAAKDTVTHAEAMVAAEQAKLGLHPDAAERLWKAIHEADAATQRHQQAVAAENTAVAHHRALKAAPFIDRQGRPATVADVQAHPAMSGQPEPSFIPGAYERQKGAVPIDRVAVANPLGAGVKVAEGRTPVAAAQLTNARVARARLIEAAKARIQFIGHFGYRENGELVRYDKIGAERAAAAAEKVTGHPMAPIINQDKSWSLVPQTALRRLEQHERTALSQGGPVAAVGRAWRQGVLAFSAKWLGGQIGEGALRTAINESFNPVKLARSHQLVTRTEQELEQMANNNVPGAAETLQRFRSLYTRGGAGRTGEQARQQAFDDFQMGEDSGRFMHALNELRRRPVPRAMGDAYGAWQKLMFDHLNGGIEHAVRRGMVGRALAQNPIFRDKGIVVTFAKAAEELAKGQLDTANQNRLVRMVDDAFGKYQGRGPRERQVIENVTPFIPWFMSAMRFLGVVLPRDHPILTSIAVASNTATEEWRRKYGLVTDLGRPPAGDKETLPLYQQGSIPSGQGTYNVTHYTPSGAMQAFGDLGSFLLPQYSDVQAAAKGEDWRGVPITGKRNEPPSLLHILGALASAGAVTAVPPAGKAADILGVRLPYRPPTPADKQTTLGERAFALVNPLPRKQPGLKQAAEEKKKRRSEAAKKAAATRRKTHPPKGAAGIPGWGGGGGGGTKIPGWSG